MGTERRARASNTRQRRRCLIPKMEKFHRWYDESIAPHLRLPEWLASNPKLYVPLLLLVIFFWPIVLTLFVTFASASAWLFWLTTSLLFGLVQLAYVVYQFFMISLDIGGLSILKTFALLRSQVRYYTIKSGLVKDGKKGRRRGRRREWRNKCLNATCYREYENIEVEEPPPPEAKEEAGGGARPSRTRRSVSEMIVRRPSWGLVSPARPPPSAPATPLAAETAGLRRRRKSPSSPTSDIRKAQSCLNLVGHNYFDDDGGSPLSRAKSTDDLRETEAEERTVHEIVEAELGMTGEMLLATTGRLREARTQASISSSSSTARKRPTMAVGDLTGEAPSSDGDAEEDRTSALKFLLTGVVKRNHLSVDDLLIDNARSVAECGQYKLSETSRDVIKGYNDEVEHCLDFLAESPLNVGPAPRGQFDTIVPQASDLEQKVQRQRMELTDRINLVRKMKQNMGRTALMLSGGGAQAMNHLGTIRALIQSDVWADINVISGTSGGSIGAAMCALCTPEELHRDVCVKTVSTDYLLNGRMKRENIRWFPKLVDMGAYWLKHKLMVDSAEFKRCCDFYYGDVTFEEAFERTGKHVCITVSASRASAGSGGGAQRLLLNHISTPHVTLSSAVAASCALPGVMAPAKLITKDSSGKLEPFEVDGVEWIDGSVQADIPFQRISTLFNVSNFIVCQTNFHVVPFLNKAHHPNQKSFYWRLFQMFEWDIRSRALNLSRLGLFPKMFGQDMSKVFKQKYHGNLTLVPRFTTMQTFGLKALVNPTVADMEVYLQNGEMAAWPYVGVIKEMIRIEHSLDLCLSRLEERRHNLSPPSHDSSNWTSVNDDVDSVTSSSVANLSVTNRVRFLSAGRETELLKAKVGTLERENSELRRQVEQLQRALGIISHAAEEKKSESPIEGDAIST